MPARLQFSRQAHYQEVAPRLGFLERRENVRKYLCASHVLAKAEPVVLCANMWDSGTIALEPPPFTIMPKNPNPEFFCYIHKRPDGRPFYVGKGTRARSKAFTAPRRNPHYKNIVAKYGKENILVELVPCKSEADAFTTEKRLIAELRSAGQELVNMTDGGEGTFGFQQPDHVRKAVGNANSLRNWTEDKRAAMARAMKGRNVSETTRLKLAARFRGKPRPQHVVEALVAANKGKKLSGERKAKTLASLDKARVAAAEWHKSAEGRKHHSAFSIESWTTRQWFPVKCHECGRDFFTPYPTRAKYCHLNCKMTALRRRRGKTVGTRPQRKRRIALVGKRAFGSKRGDSK